jgi:SSS family transporter
VPDFQFAIGSLDLFVLVAYLVGSIGLGLWVGRGQKNLSDYMLGGRDLPWWLVLGSIVATETSTVSFLSVPGLAYRGDLRFLQLPLGYLIGRLLVVVLLLPHYFRGEMYSAYEVLNRRFGGSVRQVASLLFLVTRTLGDGLRLYLTAIPVQLVTGLNLSISVAIVGLTSIAYTCFGGIKSVVWTDCLQFATYIAGAVVAAAMLLHGLPGGWNELATFAAEHGKFRMFDTSFDLTQIETLWAGVIGGTFVSLATHGADQMMVQRYLCARSQRAAAWALGLSGIVVLAQFALFQLIGVGLACFYDRFPPDAPFAKTDDVFAAFIVHHLPSGMVGLTLAAIFAAAMSGSLNSSAAAVMNDFYLPRCPQPPSPERQLLLGRALSVFFGIAQIAVGIGAEHRSQQVINEAMAIAGFTTGVILGVFFLGIFPVRATRRGALVGLLVGLGVMTWVAFATKLAWPWYTLTGASTTFFSGIIASYLLPEPVLEPS